MFLFLDMEDSYATISLSTQPKKTASSTRVLTNDKDPRWYENLYVLVYKGKKKKKLHSRLQLNYICIYA